MQRFYELRPNAPLLPLMQILAALEYARANTGRRPARRARRRDARERIGETFVPRYAPRALQRNEEFLGARRAPRRVDGLSDSTSRRGYGRAVARRPLETARDAAHAALAHLPGSDSAAWARACRPTSAHWRCRFEDEPGTRSPTAGSRFRSSAPCFARNSRRRGLTPHDYLRERVLDGAASGRKWRTLRDGTIRCRPALPLGGDWLAYGRYVVAANVRRWPMLRGRRQTLGTVWDGGSGRRMRPPISSMRAARADRHSTRAVTRCRRRSLR